MGHELIALPDRHPAIDPEALRLPDGRYFNKETSQQIALASGLPVPRILTLDEARRYQSPLWCRSSFEHPVDGWAVDMLPTDLMNAIAYNFDPDGFQEKIDFDKFQINDSGYLARNFGVNQIPDVSYFFQENSGLFFYLSTWTRGNQTFINSRYAGTDGGTVWANYVDGNFDPSTSHQEIRFTAERWQIDIIPLVERARIIFNTTLKENYEYKHDFLYSSEGVALIQSRVASKAATAEAIEHDRQSLAKAESEGIPVVKLRIKQLNKLHKLAPNDRYVLELSNSASGDQVNGWDVLDQDFRQIVGLRLPKGLEGGLLHHNGYIMIAYALYWGLPIEFV